MNPAPPNDSFNQLQRYIGTIFDDLITDYQDTQNERSNLSSLWKDVEDFTVLDELELLTVDIRGYASQIKEYGFVQDSHLAVVSLRRLRPLNTPIIAEWYFSAAQDYPYVKQYLEKLDYLRLLILEYLSTEQAI